ncbi:dephospho-CoA kinase [Bombilactobacillus thymidiniphilus]|uniref:Dephospho-CoA kinase n=1 Tax=Bombilactobacillus thymidiniphilus TaxID=2923363 RepID=A0ABY4PC60_9LACO|nr:dephospho-CoA kinase [Bombilactobacillus thymidiniphilus]UQS83353.1 dephospho-CoA kinase [Bombilactobacillus thymidiniphilus]
MSTLPGFAVMKQVIGLTGGIATGKTAVQQILLTAGYKLVDADEVARQIVAVGSSGWQQIIELFGEEILLPDQTINRKLLGQLVFQDAHALQQLNKIEQPLIRQRIEQLITTAREAEMPVFFEIPLLYEQHYEKLFDYIVVVTATQRQQLSRLQQRNNLTKTQARQRINSQLSLQQKVKLADYVIYNEGSKQQLQKQVQLLLQTIAKEN